MQYSKFYALSVFLLLATICLFTYSFGWSGTWHFDDKGALEALSQVFSDGKINPTSAWLFTLEGTAGPLGRPISLASFLLDGSGWPYQPDELLRSNSFLHVANGLLFFLVFYRIALLKISNIDKAAWIAACSAAIWLLLPIHASASLMAVQRMTLLASTFMLLGLWLYLLGRSLLLMRSLAGWLLMLTGLGVGTVLGSLSKEQALLLPIMVWVLEAWLLPKLLFNNRLQEKTWLVFRCVCFYLPTALILFYLAQRIPGAENSYAGRNFTLGERLWTQSVILWDYLRLAFLPQASSFGPFHDDYRVFSFEPAALLATAAWFVAFGSAWLYRHQSKLPLFALMWFFAAHLVESTVVGLELYFEHRNYLAVAGCIFVAIFSFYCWAERHAKRPVFAAVIGAYLLLHGFMLFQVTSLFGEPILAAEIWHLKHPKSARATQYLVQQSLEQGEEHGALRILDRAAVDIENTPILSMQSLLLSCEIGAPLENSMARYQRVIDQLPLASRQFNASSILITYEKMRNDGMCPEIFEANNLYNLAFLALNNKAISASSIEKANLHVFIANGFIEKRDLQNTMKHFVAALQAKPDISILQQAARVLISAGLAEEAMTLMNQYPPRLPKNPWLKKKEQVKVDVLRQQIEQEIKEIK